MYLNGWGVPENDAEAAKWFRKAAEQGDADAQNALGSMIARLPVYGGTEMARFGSPSVNEDDARAVKWYRKAAEQGHAGAQYHLGLMYDNGWGVPENDARAVKWYRKAAEQGDAYAKTRLKELEAK